MNKAEFFKSFEFEHCPDLDSIYLQSLWYDHQGDWARAHTLIQDLDDRVAKRIHAYLHRKEGDIWNADYWYSKAGAKRPASSLDEEWTTIVNTLLE